MPATITILENRIPVYCRLHGDGEAFALLDYGVQTNLVFVVRLKGGIVKHFYSDDIRIYENPMDGDSWNIEIPEDWKPKPEKKK